MATTECPGGCGADISCGCYVEGYNEGHSIGLATGAAPHGFNPTRHAECEECGKTLSPNQQMKTSTGRTLCFHTIANLVQAGQLHEDTRVNVSADYLNRLARGVV